STEKKFHLTFHNANPTILLMLLITLILNVFGKLTHPWCNATLGFLNMLLQTVLGTPIGHEYIPHDICAVWKKIDLEPSTCTLAICIRCSCTYAPIAKWKLTTYPE
ncbi:hypothetical protein PAXINDRAFT_84261, partial [Paxillus involutus ATCC 200175]